MDLGRSLAAGLALNRIGFGASYLAQPKKARSSWIGRAAKKPGAQVMIRSQGARDVALGVGALGAVARGDVSDVRRWALAHAFADAADLAITWLAADDLPKRRAKLAMTIAAASAAIAATAAATTSRADAP